jgi:hypothetical protein
VAAAKRANHSHFQTAKKRFSRRKVRDPVKHVEGPAGAAAAGELELEPYPIRVPDRDRLA